jgi:hypothetical protein
MEGSEGGPKIIYRFASANRKKMANFQKIKQFNTDEIGLDFGADISTSSRPKYFIGLGTAWSFLNCVL